MFVFVTRDDLFTPKGLYFVVALARELASSPLVEEVQSLASVPLATAGEAGIDVAAPFDPERVARVDFEALKRRLLGERAFARRLLSEDGRTTVLAVRVKDEFYGDEHRREIVSHVEGVLEVFGGSGIEFLVTGNAPTRDRYVEFIRRDNRLFLPAAFLVLLAALFALFRRPAWAILPALALGVSLVLTLTFMRFTGRPVTMLSSAIPVLVLVVGLSDAIHLLTRYEEELALGPGPEAALARAVESTARACILSTVTTAVGFFVLPVTGIPMLADFGIVVGVGVLAAYGVTLTLLPAVLALLPPPRAESTRPRASHLARLGAWVVDHRRAVLWAVSVSTVGLGVLGTTRLRVESRILDDLPPGHPLLATRAAVEKRLGGNFPMTFVVHPRPPSDGRGPRFAPRRPALPGRAGAPRHQRRPLQLAVGGGLPRHGVAGLGRVGRPARPGRGRDPHGRRGGREDRGTLLRPRAEGPPDRRPRLRPRDGGDAPLPRARPRLLRADGRRARTAGGPGLRVPGPARARERRVELHDQLPPRLRAS